MFRSMRKVISIIILAAFISTSVKSPVYAYELAGNDLAFLPEPGKMVALSTAVAPPVLRGIKVFANDPLNFDFILDPGDKYRHDALNAKTLPKIDSVLRETSQRLLKYFLTTLTVPDTDIWVNLSPYEKNRVISKEFGLTEMGRDLLGQDYLLKQISASLMFPEGESGKKFWANIYNEAQKRFGTTQIPVNTFNKVWIMPDKAVIYEKLDNGQATAFVVESRLKVMLESDYIAQKGAQAAAVFGAVQKSPLTDTQRLSCDIERQVIVPILEKEVNEGVNFAPLRQVYNSILLALWYKERMKGSILSSAYVNRGKVAGVDVADKAIAQKIWQRYVQAYKKGVVNIVAEEKDAVTDEIVPRKYFAGGFNIDHAMANVKFIHTLGKYARMFAVAGLLMVQAGCVKEVFNPQTESLYDKYFSKSSGNINNTDINLQTQITNDQTQIATFQQMLAGSVSAYFAYFQKTAGPITNVVDSLQAQNILYQNYIAADNTLLSGTKTLFNAYFSKAGTLPADTAYLHNQNILDQNNISVNNSRLAGTVNVLKAYFPTAGTIATVTANLNAQNIADQNQITADNARLAGTGTMLSIYFPAAGTLATVTANLNAQNIADQNQITADNARLAGTGTMLSIYFPAAGTLATVTANLNAQNTSDLNQINTLQGMISSGIYDGYLLSPADIPTFITNNNAAIASNAAAITFFTNLAASTSGGEQTFCNNYINNYLIPYGTYLTANGNLLNDESAQYVPPGFTPPFSATYIVNEQIAVLNQQIALNTTLSGLMTTANGITIGNFTDYLPTPANIVLFIADNNAAIDNNNAAIAYFNSLKPSYTGTALAFLNNYINNYLIPYGTYLTAKGNLLNDELAATLPAATIVNEQITVLNQLISLNTTLSSLMTMANGITVGNFNSYLPASIDINQFIINNNVAIDSNNNVAIPFFTGLAATATSTPAKAFFNNYVNNYLKPYGTWLTLNQNLLNDELAATLPAATIIRERIAVFTQRMPLNTTLSGLMTTANQINIDSFTNYLPSAVQLAQYTASNAAASSKNDTAISFFSALAANPSAGTGAQTFFNNYVNNFLKPYGTWLTLNQNLLNDESAQTLPPATIVREQNTVMNQQIALNNTLIGLMITANSINLNNFSYFLPNSTQLAQFIVSNNAAIDSNNEAIAYFTSPVNLVTSPPALAFLNNYVNNYLTPYGKYLKDNQKLLNDELAATLPLATIAREQITVFNELITLNTTLSSLMTTGNSIIVPGYTNYLIPQPKIGQFTAENLLAIDSNKLGIANFKQQATWTNGTTQAFFNDYVNYMIQRSAYLDSNQNVLINELKQYVPAGSLPPFTPAQIINQEIGAWTLKEQLDSTVLVLMNRANKIIVDKAMASRTLKKNAALARANDINGGVDLTRASTPLDVRNQGGVIHFRIDTAQIDSIKLSAGLAPQVYAISPLPSLSEFLGIGENG